MVKGVFALGFIASALFALLFFGCSGTQTPEQFTFTHGGCQESLRSSASPLSLSWEGNGIAGTVGVMNNCCMKNMTASYVKNGASIRVDITTNYNYSADGEPVLCRCICPYDVKFSVFPVPRGNYQVGVYLDNQSVASGALS